MEITKEALSREIERLDGKIAQELEQMKHYTEGILERIGAPGSVVNYGFSRSIANIETTVREYLAWREAFREVRNSMEEKW